MSLRTIRSTRSPSTPRRIPLIHRGSRELPHFKSGSPTHLSAEFDLRRDDGHVKEEPHAHSGATDTNHQIYARFDVTGAGRQL